jgi:hypothetical protein
MGESSGALRAALYATIEPEHIDRLVLAAFTYKGIESPTLKKRAEQLEYFRTHNMRKRDRAMIESIFTRDKAGTTDPAAGKILADVELQFGDQAPTSTYIDMTANLPVVDPKKVQAPVLFSTRRIRRHRGCGRSVRLLPAASAQTTGDPAEHRAFSGGRRQPPSVLARRARLPRYADADGDLKPGG